MTGGQADAARTIGGRSGAPGSARSKDYDRSRMNVTNSLLRSMASIFQPAFSHACACTRVRLKVLPHQVRSVRAVGGNDAARISSRRWNDIRTVFRSCRCKNAVKGSYFAIAKLSRLADVVRVRCVGIHDDVGYDCSQQ